MGHDVVDVVVVGAGIAGAALAGQLAEGGLDVVVLEQQAHYRDRVRGETIMPWGVREVCRLGIEKDLLAAGGEYATRSVPYDETLRPEEAEARPLPYAAVAPDVAGALNVGHPEATGALAARATRLGADVRTGVSHVAVEAGSTSTVTWQEAGDTRTARCRLVVGADGRHSSVRRQLGIELAEREATTFAAGLLVRGAPGAVSGTNVFGTHGDAVFYAFPRRDGLTRLYLLVAIAEQASFSGASKVATFLERYPSPSFPASAILAGGTVAGPCGGAPMTDAWTIGPPLAEGAVLVGDAAGWNDPIVGQGLSIALRDARSVAEILLDGPDWSPQRFAPYVEERAERMRRLAVAAAVNTAMRATFGPEAAARRRRWQAAFATDDVVKLQTLCLLAGPEKAPASSFTDDALAATLAL